jgi:rubrerythrin
MVIMPKLDDVFAMAEHIERNGARFYREMAEDSGIVSNVRELLLELAAMEDDHEKQFAEMRNELAERPMAEPAFREEGDAVSYLHAVTNSWTLDDKNKPAAPEGKRKPQVDVLRTAIELEKDSIMFYLGMKEMLAEGSDRIRVDDIIKEEMRHIVDLNRKLEAM